MKPDCPDLSASFEPSVLDRFCGLLKLLTLRCSPASHLSKKVLSRKVSRPLWQDLNNIFDSFEALSKGQEEAMKNIARTIEVIANVAIICVAISLGVVLISRTIRSSRVTVSDSATVKDQKIQLAGVDWSKNEQTLVLAISSTCHFCTESAAFYRDIRARTRVHTVAVLPQTVNEGRNYLSNLGVQVDEVLKHH